MSESQPKQSFNVQTYVDARLIADLALEFKRQGVPHRNSYSHLLSSILSTVHTSWDCSHFETTEEGLEWLATEGFSLGQLKTPRRARPLLKEVNKEALAIAEAEEAEVEAADARVEEITALFEE